MTIEELQRQSVRAKTLRQTMTIISVEELDMLIGAKIAYESAHELRVLLGAEQRKNEQLLAVARAADVYVEVATERDLFKTPWQELVIALAKAKQSPHLKAEIEKPQ